MISVELLLVIGIIIGIYSLLALSLTIQWGEAGLMNLAVATFFGIGAYTSTILTTPLSGGQRLLDRAVGFDLPLVVGIAGAVVVSMILGVAIATTSIRVRDDYLAIVTLGLAEIVHSVVSNEGWLTGGVQGITSIERPLSEAIPPTYYNRFYLVMVVVLLLGSLYLFIRLQRSPFGRVLHAVREDEEVAESVGKNVTVFKLKAFGIGAGMAGFAGAMWAHYARSLVPSIMSVEITFVIWTAVIVGGVGSYFGAIAGTVLLMAAYQSVQYIPQSGTLAHQLPAIRMVLIGVFLIVVMYYRPYGLFGDKRRMEASSTVKG